MLGVHARHLDSTFSTIKPEPTRRSYESLQGSSSYYHGCWKSPTPQTVTHHRDCWTRVVGPI
ncbi:MAG: hypothetical protein ACREBR_03290 [bacterium]